MAVQEFCSQCYLATVRQYRPTFVQSYQTTASEGRLGFKTSRIRSLLTQLSFLSRFFFERLSYRDLDVHIGVVLKSMTEFVKVVAKPSRSPLQRQPLVS